ncbi:MAG: hypothetical protein ACK5Z5_00565 [Neisseriaceae bacterium]
MSFSIRVTNAPKLIANITALGKVKSDRQKNLEMQRAELNNKKEKKLKDINHIEDSIKENRDAKQEHSKKFYKNLGLNTVTERAFSDFKYYLAKYDLDYKDILKRRDVELKELDKINQNIEALNKDIKQLIVSQEKYHYIKENIHE